MRLDSAIALVLGGILLALVVFAPVPGATRWITTLHDTAHAPIFGCIAVLSLVLVRSHARLRAAPILRQYVLALGLAAALGVATELAQLLTARDASFADVGRDVLGAMAFLVLHSAFDQRIHRAGKLQRTRALGIASAMLLFAILAMPIARVAIEYRERDRRFPVLADFSLQFSRYFLGQNRADVELAELPRQWAARAGERGLRVRFAAEPYPGVEIAEPVADWRGYSRLALDLTNPTDADLELVLWVHDSPHNYQYGDRLNKPLRIPANTRRVFRVSLQEIENAPATRQMDMSKVAGVVLFRNQPAGADETYLSRVWLE